MIKDIFIALFQVFIQGFLTNTNRINMVLAVSCDVINQAKG